MLGQSLVFLLPSRKRKDGGGSLAVMGSTPGLGSWRQCRRSLGSQPASCWPKGTSSPCSITGNKHSLPSAQRCGAPLMGQRPVLSWHQFIGRTWASHVISQAFHLWNGAGEDGECLYSCTQSILWLTNVYLLSMYLNLLTCCSAVILLFLIFCLSQPPPTPRACCFCFFFFLLASWCFSSFFPWVYF